MDASMSAPESIEVRKAPASRLRTLLREDVACVFQRDPAARTRFEVMTTYPGVHAIVLYRLANRMWTGGRRYLPRLLSYIARTWTGIEIHPGATIGRRLFIDHGTGLVIGETAVIGDDVTLYHDVTLGGVGRAGQVDGQRHPTIEDHAMVGSGAQVLGPVTVGERAKVGANSVVVSDVPPHATALGIPARIVGGDERERPYGLPSREELEGLSGTIDCLVRDVAAIKKALGLKTPSDDHPDCAGRDT